MHINLKARYSHTAAEIKQFTNKELMRAYYESMEIQNGHYYKQITDEMKQRNKNE